MWKHTLWGCDEAAKISDREQPITSHGGDAGRALHDTGKRMTRRGEDGHIHSYGHTEMRAWRMQPHVWH